MPTYAQQTVHFPVDSARVDAQATQAITTVAVGDIVIVGVMIASTSITVSSIADTSSRITWQSATTIAGTDSTDTDRSEMWYGVVTSTGTTTVTVTYSGSVTSILCRLFVDSWSSSDGSSSAWSVVNTGGPTRTVSSGTITYPSVTSGSAGGLYEGFAFGNQVASAGSTSGFGYLDPSSGIGQICFNGSLADNTAYQPTASYGTNSASYVIAAIFAATGGSAPSSGLLDFI